MRVLLVEDESKVARFIARGLIEERYAVDTAADGKSGLELATTYHYDLIVLDLMLPSVNGTEVLRQIRHKDTNVPVLVLSARDAVADKVGHMELGADDYLTKPFELAILIARIRGLLRRREWLRASVGNGVTTPSKEVFHFGDKSVHFDLLELHVRDQVFPLTLMEANVLRYLIQHEGKPVSRKAMLEEVWGLHEDTDTRAIDNFIVRLRRYVEEDPTHPKYLLTVRGVGYRFVSGGLPRTNR